MIWRDENESKRQVTINGMALQFVVYSNKIITMIAVKQNGLALEYATLQHDKEVVMAAVKQCGLALKYASSSLQKDREVVMEAIKQNEFALSFSTVRTKEMILEAVQKIGAC